MGDATLNIRLEPALKQHGTEVLHKEGFTVTQAVKALYEYLEKHQELPSELKGLGHEATQDALEHRRRLMKSMVGILSDDASLAEAKEARFARHGL